MTSKVLLVQRFECYRLFPRKSHRREIDRRRWFHFWVLGKSAIDSATKLSRTSTFSLSILFSSCKTSTCLRIFCTDLPDTAPARLSAPAKIAKESIWMSAGLLFFVLYRCPNRPVWCHRWFVDQPRECRCFRISDPSRDTFRPRPISTGFWTLVFAASAAWWRMDSREMTCERITIESQQLDD